MSTAAILKDYIVNEHMRVRNQFLGVNDDLLASGVLDSLGILQLVTFMEERFGVRVPDEDVVYENFHSIAAMTQFLETLQQKVAN